MILNNHTSTDMSNFVLWRYYSKIDLNSGIYNSKCQLLGFELAKMVNFEIQILSPSSDRTCQNKTAANLLKPTPFIINDQHKSP